MKVKIPVSKFNILLLKGKVQIYVKIKITSFSFTKQLEIFKKQKQ